MTGLSTADNSHRPGNIYLRLCEDSGGQVAKLAIRSAYSRHAPLQKTTEEIMSRETSTRPA